jgi:hypothetical protein
MTLGHVLQTYSTEEDRAILDLAKRPSRGYPFSKLTALRLNALRALTKRKAPLVEFTCLPEHAFKLTLAGKVMAKILRERAKAARS